ncbi:MAG: DUF4129 domain-containing protein [Halobacteriaceae archaeon]
MNRQPLAIALLAGCLLAAGAATIADPAPGALGPEPINRQQPGEPGPPPSGDEDGAQRPGIRVPGLGVTVPIPVSDLPPWLRYVVVGVGLLLVVGYVIRTARRPRRPEALDPVEPESGGLEVDQEVASAAGRAAERLLADADADVENEVYRAWQEMTELVPIDDPEASTPGEFAAAARRAGLPPADVATLTELFEAVRYGERPVTEARRTAVAEALQRVQAALETAEEDEEVSTDMPASSEGTAE